MAELPTPAEDTSIPEEDNFFKDEVINYDNEDLSPLISAFSGPPVEGEPLDFVKESTSETLMSEAVGQSDFEYVKSEAVNKVAERRNDAMYAAMFSMKGTASDANRLLTEIGTAPLPKFSSGDALASLSAPTAVPVVKKQYGSDITTADARQVNNDGAAHNLGFTGTYDEGMQEPSPVARAIISTYEPNAASETSSLEDMVEFLNPMGGENPDGMDMELWEMTKDVFTGDFDSDEFATKMESNYGEDWGKRFAGFLVKEVAIDVGILALAMTGAGAPVAAALKLGQVGLKAKLIAGVGRSAIIAAGGGAAQVAQNKYIGRDANATAEVAGRFLGAGAGEVLGAGIGSGIKYFNQKSLKSANKAAAESMGTVPMTSSELKSAVTKQFDNVSSHSAMTRATLFGDVKKYGEITNKVADGITNKAVEQDVRIGLANHLGRNVHDFDDIPMDVILPHLIKENVNVLKAGDDLLRSPNQKLLGHSLLYPIMARVQGDLVQMNNIRQLYFNKNSVSLRETGKNINRSTIPIMNKTFKAIGIAEPVKDAFQSASNWLSAKNFAANQQKGFTLMQKDIYKGLSNKDTALLHQIVRKGDGDEVVYDFMTKTNMDFGEVPANVQQAYAKFRFAQDLAYEVADAGKVAAFKDSVFKLPSGEYVQISKGAAVTNGKVKVRKFDREAMQATGNADDVLMSALKGNEIDTIIPYRQGHIPRVYRDQQHSVVIINTGKGAQAGTVAREASFDSNIEAQAYVKQRNAVAKDGEVAIKIFNNTDTGAGGVAASKDSLSLLSGMDDGMAAIVRKQLADAGIDADAARILFDNMIIPNPAKAFSKGRTKLGVATSKEGQDLRLKHAEAIAKGGDVKAIEKSIMDDLQANMPISRSSMMDYYAAVAHGAGHDNWRVMAFKDFEKRYSKIINGTPDPMLIKLGLGADTDKSFIVNLTPNQLKEKAAAIDYARWLQRAVKDRSSVEIAYDQALIKVSDTIARRAVEGSRSHKYLSTIMDSIPMAKELEANLRFVAAFPKLLTFNIAQVFVQGSQSVLSLSAAAAYNPKIALGSMFKLGQITGLEAARKLGMRVPSAKGLTSARTVHDELLRSGYIADLQSMDTMFSMGHGADPSIGRKAWEHSKTIMAAPFRFGEAVNRVTAYVTVRDQIAHAIITGKKPLGFDGKVLTKADIGTPAFTESVVDKASVLALNMGKAGELRLTSGSGSILFQFKQVLAKEMSVIDSSLLTKREKIGGAAGMIGMFGLGAIPLAMDAMKFIDYVASDDKDLNSQFIATEAYESSTKMLADNIEYLTDGAMGTENIQRFFKSGAISAATDGEWNFANRVALGNFVSDMVSVQHPLDLVVSFAVLADMADAVNTITGVDVLTPSLGLGDVAKVMNIFSYIEIISKVKDGMEFSQAFGEQFTPESTIGKYLAGTATSGAATLEAMRASGTVFSQVGSLSRILDAANRDIIAPEADRFNHGGDSYYTTSGGKPTNVKPNTMRNVQLLLGIQPGILVESNTQKNKERVYAMAFKNYSKELSNRLLKARNDRSLQNRIRDRAISDISLFKKHLTEYGLDVKVPMDAMATISNNILKHDLDIFTGGQTK